MITLHTGRATGVPGNAKYMMLKRGSKRIGPVEVWWPDSEGDTEALALLNLTEWATSKDITIPSKTAIYPLDITVYNGIIFVDEVVKG